jgi:hypothetical protein
MTNLKQSGIFRGTARLYMVGIPFLFAALQGYAGAQVSVSISPTTVRSMG